MRGHFLLVWIASWKRIIFFCYYTFYMDFKCTETLHHPLPVVWETIRDRLPEIAALQDDMEYVKVIKRAKKKPDGVHVISQWQAAPPLPAMLKNMIKPEMMLWTEDAVWDNETHSSRFSIETHYKVEDISCVGSIACTKAGRGTKVTFSGTFTIKKTSKSSVFLTGFVLSAIEALAGRLIPHNFSKVIRSLDNVISESL